MSSAASTNAAADGLVLRALDELLLTDVGAARRVALSRALEAAAVRKASDGLVRWQTFATVSVATQQLEDDLISTRRALRRATSALLVQSSSAAAR